MKKKILSLVVLILVAVCGGVFVACGGGNPANSASISVVSGLDRLEGETTLSSISSELLLTDLEKENLANGLGYNNSVSSKNAVSLIVGSETNSSRTIIVEVSGFNEDGTNINFSTDSSCVEISDVEYLSGNKAKVTVKAVSAGTAEIYVKTGKYNKTTGFVVKCIEKLERFSVKSDAVIYLEKGKVLEINPNFYFNFYPASSNLTDVEFYDGEISLSKDGKTILSTEMLPGVTGVVSESKDIVVRATRLFGGAGVQTISVVVVDSLSNLEMKKMVYNGNDFSKTYVKLENNSLLTVIRNVSNGEINYGVREVFVVVDCFEKNLEIFANTDLAEGNILIVPTYKEQITNLNYNSAKYSNLIDTSREEFSTWIFKFEFKYEGYASYNVNFKFKANGYEYLEELAVNVEFKSASNMIEVKNVNDSSSSESDTFDIYDSYVGTYGTRFIISTNTSDEFSKAILALKFSDDALNNFIVFDAVGNQKTADANGVYYFTSGENFYIRSITGSARVEPYIVFAQVSYTFENVEFSTEKTIYFNSINSPDDFVFKTEEDVELDYYNFDLNNTGKIVSGIKETELYIARNTLTLFLEGKIGGVSTGELADFVILNTSGILNVVKGENGEIVITALATGVGSFRVQLGNGVYKDFNFNVINSVSDINAFFPQENQNSNIFAVLENYENIGIIYDQYVLFKNLSKIPLILDYTGVLTGVVIDENENFVYQDGAIKAKREFEKQELIVKVSFNYIDENGEIAEKEIEIQKILLTSMTKIESFNISTNKGNNNFELYDFSSVGFYFNDLATAYIYLNVLPQSIASDIFANVVWGTNVPNSSQNVDANTGIVTITNDVFTFKFYQTGENAGMGVIVCNVTNPNLYDENGNLTLGKVVISASFSVGEGEDIGTYYKTIQFNVKRTTTVEVIDSSLTSINLDPYDSQANLVVNSFPINATNKELIYVFIPSTPWLGEDAIILTKTNDGVNIKLNPLYNYGGKGILRIIAKDSYTSASTFKTYLDIPVNIADGTEDFPYIINNSMDVQKMIDTEFKHYYIVNGEIDISNVGWESGEYVLTGTIIGKNNAKFVNYNINSVSFNDQDKEYYAGLFKEINGVIKNIAFENITFNIDLTGSTQKTNLYFGYIGAIAGKNRGTIENVSLIIGKQQAYKVVSSINVKESYKLNFGGMFGINEGTILTKITSNSINNKLVEFKTEVLIKDSTEESKTTSHQIFVGGVAGQNLSGIIKREMENGIIEFNNGFATSIVDFNIETKNSDISTQGFGGIVGNNEYVGGGIVNNPGIYNVSAYGKIFANLSNNVGGIVGNNGLKIEGALSQVQVVGNENVGGAVGFNSGELSSIYVENIEDGKATLISGNTNVGGIVGYMNGGQLTSSYFISYFAGENTDLEANSNLGLIAGNVIDGTINYVVAIADSNNTTAEADIVSENYAIYSKANDVPRKCSSGLENKTREDLKSTAGFEFVFLPSKNIDIKLTGDDNGYWENVGGHLNGNNNVGFFLYYFNSTADRVNEIVQLNFADLSKLITSSVGNKYSVISENTDVLEISGGDLIIKKPGIAILKITSPYVADVEQRVYVKIVNYSNNISGYFDQNKKNEISGEETLDAKETVMLYFDFLDKYNIDEFASPQDINLLFVATNESQTFVIKAGETVENAPFSITKISYNTYQFVPNGTTGKYEISIIPYIILEKGEVELISYIEDNETIKSSLNLHDVIANLIGLERNLAVKSEIKFTLNLENTTKSINLSKNSITTEPYYIKDVEVNLDSNKVDEVLTISVKDLNNNLVSDVVGISINGINEFNYAGEITVENINCQTNGKLTVYFRMNDDAKSFDVTQSYIIEFRTSNGKIAKLRLNYEPQEVLSISSNLYPLKNALDNDFNFEGEFSYIPSGVIIPGQNSLIEFQITPEFTYFDTIEIVNASSNQYNLLFDLYDRTEEKIIVGAKDIGNGISISKDLINKGFFSLRTFADQRLTDNSYVTILIILKDAEGNVIGTPVQKQFYIEHLPGVIVSVDGVSSGNDEQFPLKLAEGVKYDLGVQVKGYKTGNFTVDGALYIDGQIVFEIAGNKDLISIVKNADGSYSLQVNDNVLNNLDAGSRKVQIKSYGINERGEKSREVILYIEIVKFVVKAPSDLGDIVNGVVDDVYSSATGNSLRLEISLNSNILVYNNNNPSIREEVLKFLTSLSVGMIDDGTKISVWSFKEVLLSNNWVEIKEGGAGFEASTGGNIVYASQNGSFEIYFNLNTRKVVIKFKKTESFATPSLQIKYSAFYAYNEYGIPRLVAANSTSNKYLLEQIFSFDISEKTELRNPFPIYTYEQFLDMREGNYYILMNDITLPEDFKPITTLIGGFDGNNHRINISNINLIAGEENSNLVFGIFQRTSENCLLKNIKIYIDRNIEISTFNYSSVIYGLLVGENNGIITNCSIEGADLAIINLSLFGTSTSGNVGNQVGGLVGLNYGDISNSRVEVGISVNSIQSETTGYMPANLGGLVAVNQYSGSITSSYVKARVENNTAGSSTATTAGLVGRNDMGGRIFASYTSGETTFPTADELSKEKDIVYSTSGRASGFVFNNNGKISNCYSNIAVIATEGASGFVYQNETEGDISYSYSSSALQNSARNGAFVGVIPGATQEEDTVLNYAPLLECYYWEESDESDEKELNYGLGSNKGIEGLTQLDKNEFKLGDIFRKFAFTNSSDKTDGVWFWASASGEIDFLKDGVSMKFSTLAPQLVSPNILVFGHKQLSYTEYDEETEKTIYHYDQDSNYPEGSKYNPYIVASQEDFEYLTNKQSGFSTGNLITCKYIRLVSDIIYRSSTISSGLYEYSFLGNLEGNSYIIGNYVLDSSKKADNGGFFATIGTPTNYCGSVKNITFQPRYISLTNCNAVGAVAGSIYGSILVNIKVDGNVYNTELNGLTILGKNAVGGIVGIAEGAFVFNNVESNISVNSTYRSALNGHSPQEYGKESISKISYAGLIAGVANGYGKINYVKAFGDNVSVAENAALLFGYVGKNVVAENLIAMGSFNQKIKPDVYGGVIAARNLGTLKDIQIIGDSAAGYNGFFAFDNYVPLAVGNIVGFMSGGKIENAVVNTKIVAQSGVESLGGAVGLLNSGEIVNVLIHGNITGGYKIGGIVGQVREAQSYNKILIKDSFHNGRIISNSSSDIVAVGTVIGFVANHSNDGSNGGITIDFEEGGNGISIVVSDEFKNNISEKLETGEYTSEIMITTYSSSSSTEIWAGIAVVEDNKTLEKSFIKHTLTIYNIEANRNNVYAPLARNYKINGEDV